MRREELESPKIVAQYYTKIKDLAKLGISSASALNEDEEIYGDLPF